MKKIVFTINQFTLADSLTKAIKGERGEIEIQYFKDHEFLLKTKTNVKNHEVIIVQSFLVSQSEDLIKVLQLSNCLRRSGAKSVTLVAPYICCLRQEYPKDNEAHSSEIIAKILDSGHFDRILTCDVHVLDNLSHFETPITNLFLDHIFMNYYEEYFKQHHISMNDVVVVSPDRGGYLRAEILSHKLGIELISLTKERDHSDSIKKIISRDEVSDKVCLIVDDIISTGETIEKASAFLYSKGAKEIVVAISHGIISKNCTERLKKASISKIIVSNSISKDLDYLYQVVDITPVIVEAL